jgi:uncharacterized membrane-anchored protein
MQTVHPLREALHHEVHARPYERFSAPLLLTHVALLSSGGANEREHVARLLKARHLAVPDDGASHLSADIGGLRMRWEQHGEFHTCTFSKQLTQVPEGFERLPLDEVPADWWSQLPGQWLVGLHVLVKPAITARHELPPLVRTMLSDDSLVGARVMGDSADIYTDFRLYADGFARWIVVAGDMTPRRLGRLVQRLLEIETYRMMALLGFPVAREVSVAMVSAEHNLAEVAERIRTGRPDDEPELLRQLTHLAADVEGLYARTHARFSASAAYFELMQRRIDELREERVHNLQTVHEFMDRRLVPAMQTCAWAARRQQALSERISRVSNLLRTRVEIDQQQSSRQLLDAMNRRQKAQMLLQTAVEGLSVAAVTYYSAGLVGYVAKGAESAGLNVSPDLAVAISIPLIAVAVWLGVRRLHREAQAAADRDAETSP